MKSLIAFFTRIPVKGDINSALDWIFLLPFLAFVTSAIPMFILYLSHPLSPILALISFYLIVGIIHIDGLGDFFDGLMANGDIKRKLKIMKSPEIGTAGIFAIFCVFIVQLQSLSLTPFYYFLVSELNSKMSMIVLIFRGKPSHNGLGSIFIEGMNLNKFYQSLIVYVVLIGLVAVFDYRVLFSLLSLLTPLFILKKSNVNFGGINGDCIGADAEITRSLSLLISAFVITWF